MFRHALTVDAQALEPLVLLGDGVYVKTRSADSRVTLETALGVTHGMRRLASLRTWHEHGSRLIRREFAGAVSEALATYRLESVGPLLAYFVAVLVPRFVSRDWPDEMPRSSDFAAAMTTRLERSPDLDATAANLPSSPLPAPALVALGRVWVLEPVASAPSRVHVRVDDRVLAPTGQYALVTSVESGWQAEVERLVHATALRLSAEVAEVEVAADLRQQLARTGAVELGDLLFLSTTPARIGYVIPPHYNTTLHRESRRDLALTVPFRPPLTGKLAGDLKIFQRAPNGTWRPVTLSHGVCLGKMPTSAPRETDPDLAFAAYLRLAAIRIGENRRFHEHEGYGA